MTSRAKAKVEVHNSSTFQIVTQAWLPFCSLKPQFKQYTQQPSLWAKGYSEAVIHKSAQLVNSIKLPSTPRVALETRVNLLTTTVKCLQMANTAHQS